jgi:ABC-type antimicrobial peptide transport system permease subunit
MRWSEIVRAAVRDVGRRPLRNALATLGILLATALLVALLSLSAGIRSGLASRLEDQPLLTMVQVTPASPRAGESPRALDDAAVASLGRIPGVRDRVAVLVVPASLRLGDAAPSGTISGMSVAHRAPYALLVGRALEPSDVDAVVLTPTVLRGLKLGARDAVSSRGRSTTRTSRLAASHPGHTRCVHASIARRSSASWTPA